MCTKTITNCWFWLKGSQNPTKFNKNCHRKNRINEPLPCFHLEQHKKTRYKYCIFPHFFSDPQANPQENKFKAPKFTTETQVAPLHYFRKIGETFSVTCEALGNPIPEIVWLKNGHKLSSGANYIHAGKSSMDLVVLDTSDAGLYSCM